MTHPVFDWLSPSVTQHVALALVHSLWQGALIAGAAAVVLRFPRDGMPADMRGSTGRPSSGPGNTHANARYTIACLGLLAVGALPVANLLLSEAPAGMAGGPPLDTTGQRDSAAVAATTAAESTVLIEPPTDEPVSRQIEPKQAEIVIGAATSPLAPWAGRATLQWVFWAWFVGVVLLSTWHVVGWGLAQRLRRGGTLPANEVLALAGAIARRFGIRRAVAVRQTLETAAPMVIGWIKPAVVIPTSILTGLAPHELEAVLAHELAHVRRHDYLVNLLQTAVETLLFYHPAVWWLSHRIRCEREFCADDLAMRICDRREVYARSLVAVAEIARRPASRAVAATGGSLFERVRRIVRPTDGGFAPRRASRSALVGVAATVCLGIVLAAAGNRSVSKETSVDDGTANETDIALARQCVELAAEERFREAAMLFRTSFREEMTAGELKRLWQEFARRPRAGAFDEIISAEMRELHGRSFVEVRGRWEKAVMLVRLSVDEGEITGFWLARDKEGPTPKSFHRRGYAFGAEMKRLVKQIHGPTRKELAKYGIDVRILGIDGNPIDEWSSVTIWKKLESEPQPRDRTMEDPRDRTVWKRVTGSISGQRGATRNGKNRFLTGTLEAGLYRVTAFVGSRKGKMLGMAASEPVRLDGSLTTTPVTISVQDGPPVSFTVSDAETREPIGYPRPGIHLTRFDGLDVEWNPLNPYLFPGDDGEYRIGHLTPGSYRVNVSTKSWAFGYADYELSEPMTINVGDGSTNEFVLELRAKEVDEEEAKKRWPWAVEGVVSDDEGRPVKGAEIRAARGMRTLNSTMPVFTDENGRYLLRFGPGMMFKNEKTGQWGAGHQIAIISVWKPGYVEKDLYRQGDLAMADEMPEESGYGDPERTILPGKPRRVDFTLVPAVTVAGTLLDEEGSPLAEESVILDGDPIRPGSSVAASAKTDAEGRFAFDRLTPGFERWFEFYTRKKPKVAPTRTFTLKRGEDYRVALQVVSRLTPEGKTERVLRITEFKDSQGHDVLERLIESVQPRGVSQP